MKTITVTSVTVDGTDITIVGTLADQTFTQPAQQVTIPQYPEDNANWSRALRVTSEALLCLRNGANSVALKVASWAKIALTIEPSLTWPVRFTTQPVDDECVHSSTSAVFTTVLFENELTTTLKWQESADGDSWSDISNGGIYSGATTEELTLTPTDTSKNGYSYRCVATNANGNVNSDAAVLTVT